MLNNQSYPDNHWVCVRIRTCKDKAIEAFREKAITVFIPTLISYSHNCKISKRTQHLGMLFVKTDATTAQEILNESHSNAYLQIDCSTMLPTVIADDQMQLFIKLSQQNNNNIWYLPRSVNHYAVGHERVKIVSGVLAGIEGYVVRFHRDRRLVIEFCGKTLAISGIRPENFVNTSDYLKDYETLTVEEREEQYGKNPLMYLALQNKIERLEARRRMLLNDNEIAKAEEYAKSQCSDLKRKIGEMPWRQKMQLKKALNKALN